MKFELRQSDRARSTVLKQMRTGHYTNQIHPGCSWVTFTIDDYDFCTIEVELDRA